jgi:hypothetical protein
MKTPCSLLWLLGVVAAIARPGYAQDNTTPPLAVPPDPVLVHLDTPSVPGKGAGAARVDVRFFGGDEDTVYTGLSASYGFGDGWAGILRGSFAGRKTFTFPSGDYIRHGGSDVELLAKYRFKSNSPVAVAGLLGVSFPSTPAQSDAMLTLGVAASTPIGSGFTAYLNPRAVFIKDNTLAGIGLGVRARLSDTLFLIGDGTAVIAGDNTRRTSDGSRRQSALYGVALRFSPKAKKASDYSLGFDLGYTNSIGSTTGFGLTPGLGGGDGAFYAAFSVRR